MKGFKAGAPYVVFRPLGHQGKAGSYEFPPGCGSPQWGWGSWQNCTSAFTTYFDVDFSQLFYLTDTGRCWDGYKVSVRDKIPVYQDQWTAQGWVYHRTHDIIKAAEEDELPMRIMITTHPQRWTDSWLPWLKESIVQPLKNIVKRMLIKGR